MREFGWHTLGMLNSSACKRDACAMYARLGLHPILLHGVTEIGGCTCSNPKCENIGKHPVNGGWQSAPLDTAALDHALRQDWRRNIGLRMGLQPSDRSLRLTASCGCSQIAAATIARSSNSRSKLSTRSSDKA